MPKNDLKGSSVTLYTWGTHRDGGNGIAHFIATNFFGGNVGHAAIEIKLVANPNTQALVEKYCLQNDRKIIPFELTTQSRLVNQYQVKPQKVYKIYFSDTHFTQPNQLNGLPQQELRFYHRPLESRIVRFTNQEIAHLTSLSPEQTALLTVEGQVRECEAKLEALLLQYHSFSPKRLHAKKSEIAEEKTKVIEQHNILVRKRDILKETIQLSLTKELQNQIHAIRESLNNLSDSKRALVLKNRSQLYPQQAWIHYELQEIDKQLAIAQSISIFLAMHPFSDNKGRILNILFDKSYPKDIKGAENIEKWRQFLPKAFRHIKPHELTTEIYEEIQKNAKVQIKQLLEKQTQLFTEKQLTEKTDPLFVANDKRDMQHGHAPDNIIRLPISGFQHDEYDQTGLNAEKMLAKMRSIMNDGKPFHMAMKNSSATTGEILAAGAEPSLRSYFKDKAWGGVGHPQGVYNGALIYHHVIYTKNGKKGYFEKLNEWNPLNAISWLGGKMLNNVANPETSVSSKIALGIALIPMTGLAVAAETLKAFVNPKQSVQNCYRFMNYAWHTSSIVLKICTIPVGLLATALAIPAVVQYCVQKTIIEPLAKTTQERATLLQRESSLHPKPAVTRVKLGNDKLAEVDAPDPEVALATLQLILKDHPDKIPVFSANTQRKVNEYLKSLDHFVPSENTAIQSYETSIKQIYTRSNEMSLPLQRYRQEHNAARHESLDAFHHHKNKVRDQSIKPLHLVDNATTIHHRVQRSD